MKRLKFRLWDTKDRRWHMHPKNIAVTGEGNLIKRVMFEGWQETEGYIPSQYIGLEDSKGKEIYEGDILKTNYELTLEIVYSQRHSAFMCKRSDDSGESLRYCYDALYLGWHEVVGNIFENPELLES